MGALDEDTGKVRSRVEGVARCKSESGAMSIAAKALDHRLAIVGRELKFWSVVNTATLESRKADILGVHNVFERYK